MLNFFRQLFSTDFMPHVYCLRDPGLIALHSVADAVIGFAYLLIPTALLILIRRRQDLAFPWMFGLFGIFILGCGATHVLAVVTLWVPIYRFDAVLKVVTALASVGTAILLFRILPQLFLIPSPQHLRAEIRDRELAEREVRNLNLNLEQRISERTSELERANQRLAESELRLRNILDGAPALIYVKDLQGRYTFVNKALLEHLEVAVDVVVGRSDEEMFPPALAAQYRAHDRLALVDGPGQFEEGAGNSTKIFLSTKYPLIGLDGRAQAVCGMSIDITERKLAEEALGRLNRELSNSEERFRQIAELVPDMLWSAELDGDVRFISKRYQQYTGLSEEEFAGDGWRKIVHPEEIDKFRQHFPEAAASKQSWEFEVRLRRHDGIYRWFMSRTTPICNENGAVDYWLGSFNDIDEIKRAEQALRRSNEELEQFAYAAAHDLQEPLRNISNSLGMFRRQFTGRLGTDEEIWIAESVKNAIRMQAMVKDLLLYSRVISEGEPAPAAVNAASAAELATANLNGAIGESGAQVIIGALPEVPVHEQHLVALFQNLIGNSIKYRRLGAQPVINISASLYGTEWEFSVSDNGIGFDPAYSERIFKVFKRLHSRDEYSGNGIGLAICARIVAHYGGRIWAEGRLGEGATFRFTLPAHHKWNF